MGHKFFDHHLARLNAAKTALAERGYWSAFPEVPSGKIYGVEAAAQGEAALQAYRGRPFALAQPTVGEWQGGEISPFDGPLGITYPRAPAQDLIGAALATRRVWRDAGIEARTGICLEILERLNKRSFELAQAVMHTTGQGFVMAFQAGGPHAQDRGLEAVALAHVLMSRTPAQARFDKPAGRDKFESLEKTFTVAGRGVGLVVACSTFPTWNSYGAIFANLACGNPTIVKPHPQAILPLAITVKIAQEVLAEAEMPPTILQLAVDSADVPVTKELAQNPAVKLIDYTGSNAFADWLASDCRQAIVFAEKAGVNLILLDSTGDYKSMLRNLAFSISLYSGQMCTTPQNFYVSEEGLKTDQGDKSPAEFAADLGVAVDKLLGDDERAAEVLGMIINQATHERCEQAQSGENVVRRSTRLDHPKFSGAQARTPLILQTGLEDANARSEQFGPISYVIACPDRQSAMNAIATLLAEKGAITAAIYSTNDNVLAQMRDIALDGGVALSENLLGGTFVNQSTAFSDFHATGLNPAANAALTDEAFIAPRFAIVQSRRPVG